MTNKTVESRTAQPPEAGRPPGAGPACEAAAEINVFVRSPEGFEEHVKLTGMAAAKVIANLRALNLGLQEAGFTPSQRNGAGAGGAVVEDDRPACPEHGRDKVAPSKFAGWYCKKRLPDGTYCKWQSDPKPAPVRAVS